jgi:hypothetical protein
MKFDIINSMSLELTHSSYFLILYHQTSELEAALGSDNMSNVLLLLRNYLYLTHNKVPSLYLVPISQHGFRGGGICCCYRL